MSQDCLDWHLKDTWERKPRVKRSMVKEALGHSSHKTETEKAFPISPPFILSCTLYVQLQGPETPCSPWSLLSSTDSQWSIKHPFISCPTILTTALFHTNKYCPLQWIKRLITGGILGRKTLSSRTSGGPSISVN